MCSMFSEQKTVEKKAVLCQKWGNGGKGKLNDVILSKLWAVGSK